MRHRDKCLGRAMVVAAEQHRHESAADLYGRIKAELDVLVEKAKHAQDARVLLGALAQLRGLLELHLKAQELHSQNVQAQSLTAHPEWPAFIGRVLDVLDRHPNARNALLLAIHAQG